MTTEWKLAAIIAHHGVKGREIAKEVGVCEETITKWKREAPPLSRWDAIAEAITKNSRKGDLVRGIDLVEDKINPKMEHKKWNELKNSSRLS